MTINIFFVGATGYIGGTALSHILNHYRDADVKVRALVRTEQKSQIVLDWAKSHGFESVITTVLGSLDDKDILISEVLKSDVIIETAHSDHVPSAEYFTEALRQLIQTRKPGQSKPLLIHTSGTGLLTDKSYGFKTTDTIYHDDNDDEINSLPDSAPHRDVDLIYLNFLKEHSSEVDIAIVAPPTIWGLGTGPDSIQSIQIPLHINRFLPLRQSYNIGKGLNVWNQINVIDLADFYLVHLLAALKEPGEHSGFYFVENGEFTWNEVGQAIQDGLVIAGFTNEKHAKDTLTDEEYYKVFGRNEKGFPYRATNGGNSRSRAVKAKKLGWNPKYSSHQEFLQDIRLQVIVQAKFGKDNTRDVSGRG